MATWPASLPQAPVRGSWSEEPRRRVRAFSTDTGHEITRRISATNGYSATASFDMTTAEVAIFWDFFEVTTKGGSLPFDWTHPRLLISKSWKFNSENRPQEADNNYDRWLITVPLIRRT